MKCIFDVLLTWCESQLLVTNSILSVCLFINSPYLSTLLTCCCDCECCATKKFNCLFFIRFSSSVIKQFVFFSLISFILSLNTFSLNVSVFMQKQPINNRLAQSILGRLFWCSCTSQIAQINRSPNWRILWSTTSIEKKLAIKNRNISSTIVESSHEMNEPISVRSRHCEM